jgi:predicted aldo/keto reductase-like oxidoreductase
MTDKTGLAPNAPAMNPFFRRPASAFGKPVCRLGFASRIGSVLAPEDAHHAIECGVNFLNWPGSVDILSQAISELGEARERVIVCAQFEARKTDEAAMELRRMLADLKTDYLDIVTFYYVEESKEWEQLIAPKGALSYCEAARRDGLIGKLGMTTHQRGLAAEVARGGRLDLLMLRYNAAHRGAETEVFPLTDSLSMPIVAYTALRWGALLHSTPDDPPGFLVPPAPSWYRFVLQCPSVGMVLMAPSNRAELDEDLSTLGSSGRCRRRSTSNWRNTGVASAGTPVAFLEITTTRERRAVQIDLQNSNIN